MHRLSMLSLKGVSPNGKKTGMGEGINAVINHYHTPMSRDSTLQWQGASAYRPPSKRQILFKNANLHTQFQQVGNVSSQAFDEII